MVAKNDITGDAIQTKGKLSAEGEANWDTIFPPKKKERYVPPPIEIHQIHREGNRWEGPPINLDEPVVSADQLVEYSEDWQSEKRATAIAQNGNVGYNLEDIYAEGDKDYGA